MHQRLVIVGLPFHVLTVRHAPSHSTGNRPVNTYPATPLANCDSIGPPRGRTAAMLTILLIVLLVVLLLGGIGGPRYYRGYRGRRTVVREYETDI